MKMELITQNQEQPIEANIDMISHSIDAQSDPGDFIILKSDSGQIRAAGPVKSMFYVQLDITSDNFSGERDNISAKELKHIMRSYFNGDISFSSTFKNRNRHKTYIFVLLFAVFAIGYSLYATAA